MVLRRISVTLMLVFVSSAAFTACKDKRERKATTAEKIKEGDQKVKESLSLKAELADQFGVNLSGLELEYRAGRGANAERLAGEHGWASLTLEERQAAKQKLYGLIAALNRILQLDAEKGVAVSDRERFVRMRDAAVAYQKSLEAYESRHGESYSPSPRVGRPPAPKASSAG